MAIAPGVSCIIFYAVPAQLPCHLATIALDHPCQASEVMGATVLTAAVMAILLGRIRLRLVMTLRQRYPQVDKRPATS